MNPDAGRTQMTKAKASPPKVDWLIGRVLHAAPKWVAKGARLLTTMSQGFDGVLLTAASHYDLSELVDPPFEAQSRVCAQVRWLGKARRRAVRRGLARGGSLEVTSRRTSSWRGPRRQGRTS